MDGFCLTLLSEADRPAQTLKQSGAGRGAEQESFSCRPADVPHPHVLMAFYGSLESLWLLLTQWDSLQRQRGLQREGLPQYIADAKGFKHKERRHCLASGEILTSEYLDLIRNVSLFWCSGTLDYLYASFWAFTMCGLHRECDYPQSLCKPGRLGLIFSINSVVTIWFY